MSQKRRVIEIQKFGPASVLAITEKSDVLELKANEVQIKVYYSGINFADIIMRLGLYRDAPPKPFILGYELSGVVSAVGSSVTRFQVGDSVMAGTRFGGYVDRIHLPEAQVFPLPKNFSLEQAAALPVNYLTAYIGLHEFARVRVGDKVLLENASGGVGIVAMQMAKSIGASVIGLTTSPGKKEFIESYGAKAMTVDEFAASNERDFDFVLSSSGGKALKEQYSRLAKSGKIVCIGVQGAIQGGKGNLFSVLSSVIQAPIYSIFKLIMDSRMMGGFNALKYFDDQEWIAKAMSTISDGAIIPHVGKVFPAEQVAEAHHCLETKQARGKVLLRWQ